MSLLRFRLSLDFEEEVAKIFELLDIGQLRKAYEKKEN